MIRRDYVPFVVQKLGLKLDCCIYCTRIEWNVQSIPHKASFGSEGLQRTVQMFHLADINRFTRQRGPICSVEPMNR